MVQGLSKRRRLSQSTQGCAGSDSAGDTLSHMDCNRKDSMQATGVAFDDLEEDDLLPTNLASLPCDTLAAMQLVRDSVRFIAPEVSSEVWSIIPVVLHDYQKRNWRVN